MKSNLLPCLLCCLLTACNESKLVLHTPPMGGEYTISTQEQVRIFEVDPREYIKSLIIEGEEITDLTELKASKIHNLTIKRTSIKELSYPSLRAVADNFIISNNRELTTIKDLSGLQYFHGNFKILDNPVLAKIIGLATISEFNGKLIVTGNKVLGENLVPLPSDDFGFGPILTLINKGVISASDVVLADNHQKASTDARFIGIPEGAEYLDYILTSKEQVLAFDNYNKEGLVGNLTITGSDINDDDVNSLIGKIKVIKGDFVLENTSVSCTNNRPDMGFFSLKFEGGITIKDNPRLNNINTFCPLKEIKGDLIIDNCPVDFAWDTPVVQGGNGSGFQNISHIGGRLIIRNIRQMAPIGLKMLKTVGGLEIVNCGHGSSRIFIDFGPMLPNFTEINGNIILKNNAKLVSLNGWQNIKKITGSKVEIEQDLVQDGSAPGFCWLRWAYENGIFTDKNVQINLKTANGTVVDFDTLKPCENCPHK